MATARTRTAAPKPRARPKRRPAALPVAAAKSALDRATRDIRKLQRDSSKNAWAIGRRLVQVSELGLHRARGFGNLADYAATALSISEDVAFQCMRVAQAFSEEMVADFGPEKLDRALRYIAATPADEKPADIPTLSIPVTADDGTVTRKPFERATAAEIRRATAGARDASAKPARRPAALDADGRAALTQRANEALDGAVGRAAAAEAEFTLRARHGRDAIELRGVPLDKAPAALRALAAALGRR